MIVEIEVGVGTPGKLWTSTDVLPLQEEGEQKPGQPGSFCEIELLEQWSSNGATTRRLKNHEGFSDEEVMEFKRAMSIPILHIATGGVGSLPVVKTKDDIRWDVALWNWSGRIGGFAVLNPILVRAGYYTREDLPKSNPGFAWIHVYNGNTLDEFILVQLDESGRIHPRHRLPLHRRPMPVLSPPERQAEKKEEEK